MNGDLDIRPAEGARSRREFLDLPFRLYRDDPNWAPPLRSAQAKLLAGKTAFFRRAELALFLARRSAQAVGRIAAIHNRAHLERHQDGVGFFGFFECRQGDLQAAAALFRSAEDWLRQRGLTTLRGPVNPSMNAECGLLIDGFDSPPMAMMAYNPPFYAELLEAQGLRKLKDLYAYRIEEEMVRPGSPAVDRLRRLAEALQRRHPEVALRTLNMRDYAREVPRFMQVFEEARHNNWGYVPLSPQEIAEVAQQMKHVLDPEIVLLAEVDGQPAGAMLCVPNVNRALAAVRGRLFPLGFLKFFRELKRVREMRVVGSAALERFRPKGVAARLFAECIVRASARGYRLAEASWVLEDNLIPDRTIQGAVNPQRYKTYRLYEKPLTAPPG
jgi:GNAT superfamily N-acetyltransferase